MARQAADGMVSGRAWGGVFAFVGFEACEEAALAAVEGGEGFEGEILSGNGGHRPRRAVVGGTGKRCLFSFGARSASDGYAGVGMCRGMGQRRRLGPVACAPGSVRR